MIVSLKIRDLPTPTLRTFQPDMLSGPLIPTFLQYLATVALIEQWSITID